MPAVILAINAGSSSLKTTLFAEERQSPNPQLRRLARAEISALNDHRPRFKYIRGAHKYTGELERIDAHKDAFEYILQKFLSDEEIAEVSNQDDIRYACHRVVQGGDFEEDQLITRDTYEKIEKLSDLAPLHNASAVSLMNACHELLPNVTNVACFDSAFHSTMPEYVKTYAIDQTVATEKGLRKYGFHGLSYAYITRRTAKYLDKPVSQTSLIALHLGSGASACAIMNGNSVDTTMGLTPVSGLPGATRSGDIDPSLVFHYTSEASKLSPASTKDLHISSAEEILNKKSGWCALTGTTDFSQIAAPNVPPSHQLAFNIFVDRIAGYIGNYYVKLGGRVDALIFAGGIGEKSAYLRQAVTRKVACLGFTLDDDKNEKVVENDDVIDIGSEGKVRTLVCLTDEDYEMAYNTLLHPK